MVPLVAPRFASSLVTASLVVLMASSTALAQPAAPAPPPPAATAAPSAAGPTAPAPAPASSPSSPPVAAASPQPGAGSPIAEALFQQGRALLADGKTAEACDRFAQSQRIEPKLGTLLNLAACHEALGLVATAWAEFTSAATIARRDGQADREAFAREHVEALARRLSTVRVVVATPPAGAALLVDGAAVPLTDAPLPVDPGSHRIEVTAPGHTPWSTTFTVDRDASVREIHVPALAVVGAEPPPPSTAASASATGEAADETSGDDGGIPPLAIVGFSIGGAGLLLGSITGLVAIGQTSDIEDRCDGGACSPAEQDDIDAANTMANVSNVSFALGLAGIGVGVVALLLDDDAPGSTSSRPAIEPVIGLGAAGTRGRF